MNTIWSDYIQTTEELYLSRSLRFRDDNKNVWLPLLQVQENANILEIGCAGGVLLHMIKTAVPVVIATGIDRDTNHISYAIKKSNELELDCKFITADALSLPFNEDTFDLVYSHTVIEHVETQPFLREQFRVLKPNTLIKVLSVRTGLNVSRENWKPTSEQEQQLFEKAWKDSSEFDKQNNIGSYEMKECDYPIALKEAEFTDIDIQFMSLMSYAPDNASVTNELALKQINTNRIHSLEGVNKALRRNPQALTPDERNVLVGLINNRYDERVQKYLDGEKIWDVATSTVMVVTGKKPN